MGTRPRRLALVLLLSGLAVAGCRKQEIEPLDLQGAQLQISNDTGDDWRNAELWLNRYFRATVSSIPAHSRYKVPLNAFVSGYAQRFDFSHMQITSLRLTASTRDGSPVIIDKKFQESGLAGALGGTK